jgi:hypothetical protein
MTRLDLPEPSMRPTVQRVPVVDDSSCVRQPIVGCLAADPACRAGDTIAPHLPAVP